MFSENGGAQVEYALIVVVLVGVLMASLQLASGAYRGSLHAKVIETQAAAARELRWLF